MIGRALTDEQYLAFLSDGFLQLTAENLTDQDHAFFYRRAADLYEISDALESPTAHLDILGDNLRPQVPEVDVLLNDPIVDGALTSLLGPDYLVHPHSYCHRSGSRDQVFHQDGNLPWNERAHQRTHRPEWAILFYYPETVDETNGPTEIIPGTQYFTTDNEIEGGAFHPGDRVDRTVDEEVFRGEDLALRDQRQAEALERGLPIPGLERRFLHLPAGSIILAHYDLFHRGTRVAGAPRRRYMYKFNMVRTREPARAAHSNHAAVETVKTGTLDAGTSGVRPALAPIVQANLAWLRGTASQVAADAQDDGLIEPGDMADLASGRQDRQLAAAYRLGGLASTEPEALQALERALTSETEAARRAAAHGLRQAGSAGVAVLLRGLASPDLTIRRPSVAGLGTAAAASTPGVVAAMVAAMVGDPDDLVRSNAAYSLGHVVRASTDPDDVAAIVDGLLDRLTPGVEPDNAFGAGFGRSTIRQSAGYGLALALCNHSLTDAHLDAIIDGPLRDSDRYVQGLVAEGLARTAYLPAPARRRMVGYLVSRRWNRSPNPDPVGSAAGV